MMAGIHHMDPLGFGDAQHFGFQPLATCADSQEECSSPDPEANSSDTEQDSPHIPNDDNALQEMVDIGMPVVLNPEVLMCGTNLHLEAQLTFSSNGFKIEYLDSDSGQDGNLLTLFWEVSDIISIDCKRVQMVPSALITLHARSSAVNSGPVKVQFFLADPQWEGKQQKIWQLDSRYQEVWKKISLDDFASQNWSADAEPSLCFPELYFNGSDDFEDFTYPKGDRDAVEIKSSDLKLLLPETFVNDTIIDFYIKYLSTRIEPTERRRYHFFNCFFFRKLADLDKDQEKAPKGREAFLCVRKWTRKIDIFAKDFLFIPVNFSLHWSLLVICYPGEVDTFDKDGDARTADKVPCIMHMNSIKGTHSGLKDIIQSYLWEEWKERHPESTSSDKFLNLRFLSLEVPQQGNLFDCGLFLLHYLERFLMDAPSLFNPMQIDVFSSFLGYDWFVPAEASLKRSVIRKLIYELVIEPSKTFPRLVCGGEKHDESHHRSEKAVGEPSREYLAQGRCAAEPDSVGRILGAHQQPKLISLNDSEKGLPVPVCILGTGGVSMVAEQEIQVCPSDDDVVVCLPSQDAKEEPFSAHSGNQADHKSCAPEDAEEFKGIWDQLARPAMVDDMNDGIAECSSQRSTSEAMDPGAVEDDATAEKASTTAGSIDDSEQYVSSEPKDGNSGGIMSSDRAVSCGLTEGNVTGGTRNGTSETHANAEDVCDNLETGEVAPSEDDTTCIDVEIPHVNCISICSAKEETNPEKATCNAGRPLLASTSEDESKLVYDDMCSLKGVECSEDGITKETDKINDSTRYASSEARDGNSAIAGESTQGTDADYHELAAFPCEVGADAPHVDGTCCAVDENKSISLTVCEAKKMQISEEFRPTAEDGIIEGSTNEGTDVTYKRRRVCKRRKVCPSDDDVVVYKRREERADSSELVAFSCEAMEMVRSWVTFGDRFWLDYREGIEGRVRLVYRRRKARFWVGYRDAKKGSAEDDDSHGDSEHDDMSKARAKNEKCRVGAKKRAYPESKCICDTMEMVRCDERVCLGYSLERRKGRFRQMYRRRIVYERRKKLLN